MAARNYWIIRVNTHTGSDSKTATFDVGVNERFTVSKISMTATSTDADITEMKDSNGMPYGSLSSTNKLGLEIFVPSTALTVGGYELEEPIVLVGGQKLYITTLDASGAGNVIEITLHGKLETA